MGPTEHLNEQQRAAVTHVGGPCLVLAGAGSGKTRVITQRIAWLIEEQAAAPESICAVTFTNKAAAEMRARVEGLVPAAAGRVWLLTFHSLGLRLLRSVAGAQGGPKRGFAIADRADALSVWRACQAEEKISADHAAPNMLYELCSRAVNRLEDPRAWDAAGQPSERRAAGRIFGRYRRALRDRNALDFDDLLVWPLRLLDTRAAELEAGAAARDLVGNFRHLLVDEYQDTNRLQYRLVRALSAGDTTLVVVGDEDQAIYRWRGADIANVLQFQEDFPDATVVRLEQNYRSTQPILRAANSLIDRNRERLGKNLWSAQANGELPQFVRCASERSEAVWICKQIGAAIGAGVAADEIAVLYRTNAQSRPFEEELAGRALPFRVIGGPTFFKRSEVKDLLAYLRLLLTDDDVALARAASRPARGVGPATLQKLAAGGSAAAALRAAVQTDPVSARDALCSRGIGARAAEELVRLGRLLDALREQLDRLELAELVDTMLQRSGYREMLRGRKDGEDRIENLDELAASAAEYGGGQSARDALQPFLDRSALIADVDGQRGSAGVHLLTVHAAKGLEFRQVFLAGLEEGLFPHGSAVRDGHVEEERRLAYVAMTRARQTLNMTSARLRRIHGRERFQDVSRFVSEIDADAIVCSDDPASILLDAQRRETRGRQQAGPHRRATPAKRRARAPARPVDPNARGTGVTLPLADLGAGQVVFHPMFGPGRITAAAGSGDKLKVTVAFARAGTKQLIARFAKLQGVSPG